MTNRFQGDPKVYMTKDGADLNFIGGQPEMDAGFENQVLISLFSGSYWWGNDLIDDVNQQISSDFEEKAKGPITLKKLAQIEQDAKRNIEYSAFGDVEVTVTNPQSNRLDMQVLITPPGKDVQELRLTKNAQNWQNQAIQGANNGT